MELNLKSMSEAGIERNVKGVANNPSELIGILGEFVRITLANTNVALKLVLLDSPAKLKLEGDDEDEESALSRN